MIVMEKQTSVLCAEFINYASKVLNSAQTRGKTLK